MVGSDYHSEIFYTSDQQRQAAEDTIADAAGFGGAKVVTKISEAGPFWAAEADDQDYLQRYTRRQQSVQPVSIRGAIAAVDWEEPPGPSGDALLPRAAKRPPLR